ncbi:MAG: HAD hydrolase-like protein, partial [Candidatus Micrarchaeota archaeon]
MNKAIIFDWSGTLSDNFHCFCKVCGRMFKELGRPPISEEEIRLNFTIPYMKFWNKYFPDLAKEKQDDLYQKCMHEAGEPKTYPGAEETVKHLHDEEFKIFVVSSDWNSILLP